METLKVLLGASVAGLLSSVPLWLLVLIFAILGLVFLVVFFPVLVAVGAAMVTWYLLYRAGVRGPALFIVPVIVSLIAVLFPAKPLMVSSLGAVGTIVDWFVWGPSIVVLAVAAAFGVVFLVSALKVGGLGALVSALIGGIVGMGIAVGSLGAGPSMASASTATASSSLPVYPVLGFLLGAVVALSLLLRQ